MRTISKKEEVDGDEGTCTSLQHETDSEEITDCKSYNTQIAGKEMTGGGQEGHIRDSSRCQEH